MRVLMTTTAGIGHLFPLVPLGWAYQRAGHEVRVAAPASFAGAVESSRLAYQPLPDYAPEHLRHVEEVFAAMGQPGAPFRPDQEATFVREVFGWAKTDSTLNAVRAVVADWRPDLVLHEATEMAGVLAAEEAGIAHATVAMGLRHTLERWLPHVAAGAAQLAESIGLRPDPAARTVLDAPYLSCVPAGLEHPDARFPPTTRRYRLTALHPLAAPVDLAGDGPLVWVTFGTEAWQVPGALNRIAPAVLEAAANLPGVRFLLTTGHESVSLDTVPDNVRVETYVPQEQVLVACDAVVFHAGFNTTMATLAHGRPCVLLPLFSADQHETAPRVDATGAGIWVQEPTAARIREALQKLLRDPGPAAAARKLAAEMAALPTPDQVIADGLATVP